MWAWACEKHSSKSSLTSANADACSKACTKKAVLSISGMGDGCCASKVKSALSHCQGVKSCNINYKAGTAEVEFTNPAITEEKLIETVDRCGFKASLTDVKVINASAEEATPTEADTPTQKAVLKVSGMTCGGCASEVKSALTKVEGVKECKVSWKEGKAEVGFTGDQAKANELVKAVNKTGFKASLASVETITLVEEETEAEETAPRKQMVLKDKETFKATSYVCEDCGYRQAKGGKCPSGNCKLTKVSERHTYVCEQCDYAQAKPGVCPGHKTDLVEYSVQYECPACKMVYEKAGTCTMCNKKLQAVTDEPVKTGKQVMQEESM